MPASRGYAHREWGHPSRVSRRLARRRGCLMRCVHLTVCASRCHSIAASFRRGAALHRARRVRFSRRPGRDRTGQARVRAPSPGAVERPGRCGWSKEQRRQALIHHLLGLREATTHTRVLVDDTHGVTAPRARYDQTTIQAGEAGLEPRRPAPAHHHHTVAR